MKLEKRTRGLEHYWRLPLNYDLMKPISLINKVSLIVGTKKANEFDDQDIERIHLILTIGLNQVSKNEILKKVKLKGTTPSFEDLLEFLMDSKWVSMTHPESPNRPDQKYYTTETGKAVLKLGKE